MDKSMMKGVRNPLQKIQKMELTIPQSPAITKPRPPAPMEPSPERIIKANPMPDVKPFEPKIAHRKIEVPQFELPGETVRQRKLRELEEKRKQEEEERLRAKEFKAQPIPTTLDVPAVY